MGLLLSFIIKNRTGVFILKVLSFIFYLLSFIFLSSCSNNKKSDIQGLLNETERMNLLYLLDDLYKTDSCYEVESLIENNRTLEELGRQYDLPRGYLFDIFSTPEKFKDQSFENKLFSEILNLDSKKYINQIIDKVISCDPFSSTRSSSTRSSSRRSSSRRSSSRRSSSTRSSSTQTTDNTNSSVCLRTEAVRRQIMNTLDLSCGVITEAQLQSIVTFKSTTRYDGRVSRAETFKVIDFVGLTSLTDLILSANNMRTLPAGLFSDLTSLENITMFNNDNLETLPAGLFNGLTALTSIDLSSNGLETLPAGLFNGLTALTSIDLGSNDLGTLPAGLFNGLTALTSIDLSSNGLETLPAGLFNGLTALTSIDLRYNSFSDAEKQRIRAEIPNSVTVKF